MCTQTRTQREDTEKHTRDLTCPGIQSQTPLSDVCGLKIQSLQKTDRLLHPWWPVPVSNWCSTHCKQCFRFPRTHRGCVNCWSSAMSAIYSVFAKSEWMLHSLISRRAQDCLHACMHSLYPSQPKFVCDLCNTAPRRVTEAWLSSSSFRQAKWWGLYEEQKRVAFMKLGEKHFSWMFTILLHASKDRSHRHRSTFMHLLWLDFSKYVHFPIMFHHFKSPE